MSTADKILYPNQLKPCTEDLRDDELIRRLKVCENFCCCFFLENVYFNLHSSLERPYHSHCRQWDRTMRTSVDTHRSPSIL